MVVTSGGVTVGPNLVSFQYPSTGRCGCNTTWSRTTPRSTAFQYPSTGRCGCNRTWHCGPGNDYSVFQYPSTGRCGCNDKTGETQPTCVRVFQYPSTGRCGCNDTPRWGQSMPCSPFSTLQRVDVVVTSVAAAPSVPAHTTFSTLQRVDVVVT